MRFILIIVFLGFISCGNEVKIQLPKSNISIVENVDDLSPVYIFFKINGIDTLADVNRKNTIISTNWVFNIDKRLPLRLVIPEVMKLQDKKRNDSEHKNELAQNYYTYADSIKKNLAFLPFTKLYYKLEKPIGTVIYFNKKNEILIENNIIRKENLVVFLENPNQTFVFRFNKNLDYGSYIQNKIFIAGLKINMKSKEEYIY